MFQKKQLFSSHQLFLGAMMWTYRKKSSSNIFQPTRSPHPRWLQECPPSAPITLEVLEERLTSEGSSGFPGFHGSSFTRCLQRGLQKWLLLGFFFNHSVTDNDKNLGKWSELLVTYETRCSNNLYNVCHAKGCAAIGLRQSSGGSASSCACSISGRITLGKPNVMLWQKKHETPCNQDFHSQTSACKPAIQETFLVLLENWREVWSSCTSNSLASWPQKGHPTPLAKILPPLVDIPYCIILGQLHSFVARAGF